MAETLQKENAYSGERIKTAPLDSPAEIAPHAEAAGEPSSSPRPTIGSEIATLVERAGACQFPSLAELAQFFHRTRRLWLGIGGVILALFLATSGVERFSAWVKNRRETRQEKALATL